MSRIFFNSRAGVWDDKFCEQDRSKLGEMASRLGIEPGARVLDIGSGTGIFLPFLLGKAGPTGRIVALDYAEEMLKKASAKRPGMNVDYTLADAAALPFAGAIFEVVVCYSCFPHFRDKPGVLAEIQRVIRPGGHLYICHTSSREHINDFHRRLEMVKNDCLPEEALMRRLVMAAGFDAVRIEEDVDSYLLDGVKKAAV